MTAIDEAASQKRIERKVKAIAKELDKLRRARDRRRKPPRVPTGNPPGPPRISEERRFGSTALHGRKSRLRCPQPKERNSANSTGFVRTRPNSREFALFRYLPTIYGY